MNKDEARKVKDDVKFVQDHKLSRFLIFQEQGWRLAMEMIPFEELNQTRGSHKCRPRKPLSDLSFTDIASAGTIFLSVVITLVEACYIHHANFRMFANGAQAVCAAIFNVQWGYKFYLHLNKENETDEDDGDEGIMSLYTRFVARAQSFFTTEKDALWNVFDGILNVVSILDIFVDTWEGRFVHGLAALRVARSFRLFRIFASNKFLKDLNRVLHTALLQMVNFGIVIVGSLVLASVVATNMLWDFPDERVAESYSDLGTTMWTLFKIMTMDGWISSVTPCIEMHPSLLYFYAMFVYFSLSSISIIPAIFIEILIEEREKIKAQKQRRRRKERIRDKQRAIRKTMSFIGNIRGEPENSDDSSCYTDSSSEPDLMQQHAERHSAVVKELLERNHSLLLGLQKGDDLEAGHARTSIATTCDHEHQQRRRRSLSSTTEDMGKKLLIVDEEFSTIARISSDLETKMDMQHAYLLERLDRLEHAILQRFDTNHVIPSQHRKAEPSEQEAQSSNASNSSFQRGTSLDSACERNDPAESTRTHGGEEMDLNTAEAQTRTKFTVHFKTQVSQPL